MASTVDIRIIHDRIPTSDPPAPRAIAPGETHFPTRAEVIEGIRQKCPNPYIGIVERRCYNDQLAPRDSILFDPTLEPQEGRPVLVETADNVTVVEYSSAAPPEGTILGVVASFFHTMPGCDDVDPLEWLDDLKNREG
jgi:hypothetical protein